MRNKPSFVPFRNGLGSTLPSGVQVFVSPDEEGQFVALPREEFPLVTGEGMWKQVGPFPVEPGKWGLCCEAF